MTGGSAQEQAPQEYAQQQPQQPQQTNPCGMDFQKFFECTQTQGDISMCQGLNDMLKECKIRYGIINIDIP